MNKTRVYQLAKELNMSNKELLDKMAAMKIEAHNHMSTIEEADVTKLKNKGGKPSDQEGKDNKSIVNVAIKQSVRHVVHGIQGVGTKGQNHGDEKRDEIKDLKVTVLEEAKRPAKTPVKAKTQPKHEEVHESKERVTRIPAAAKQEAAEHEHHERKGMRIPAAVAHASEQHEPAKQEAVQHTAPVTPNKPMESTDLVKEKQPVHEKTAEVKTEATGHKEAMTEALAKPQPKEDVKPAAVKAPAPTPTSVENKEASTPKVEPAKAPVQGQAAATAPAAGQPQNQPQTQRPYTPREGQTGGQGQRPYTPRDGQQGQRPYTPRDGQTGTQGQRPYTPRDGQQGQRPYTPREGQTGTQGQRPYTPRDGQQGQRPYTPRDGQTGTQGQRPYTPRDGQQGQRPYTPREGQTGTQGQRPYTPRDGQSSPRPYTPRDGSRPYTPRPAGSGGYGDRKPGAPAGDKDRTYPPGTARPKRPAAKAEGDTSLPYADRASISGHTKHVKKDDVKKKVEDKNINKKKMLLTTGQHSMQRTEVRRGKKYKKDKQKQNQLKEMDGVIENQAAENLIKVQGSMTVGAFATILDKPATDIILKLMNLGIMATINKDLDIPTLEILAADYDYVIESVEPEKDEDLEAYEFEDAPEDLVKRPPIVTVMGHVDHGKTSLLDAIRNTRITTGEAGGITQHIGASEVFLKNEKIVFLDTPGHEAFTTLRARGAKVTDIAILVVAADDGVMPQTMEAIDHARAAKVPIIIAINKIDKANANPDRVKQELADYGLLVEDWGGDIVSCEVSALKGQGIDTLLEMVLLVAEIQDLKANPNRAANGTIIDAKVEKGRGTVATVIVQNGTLNIGDAIVVGPTYGKIKAMYNDSGKTVKAVMPSSAVEIIGLNEIPNAGDKFYVVANEKVARSIAERRSIVARESSLNATNHITLEDLFSEIQKGSVKDLNIVVKADVQGSVEALKSSLLKITNEEVRINVIHASVGTITESDVLLASASNAIIIGFNVRPVSVVSQMADKERVAIKTYRIIYEAINDVEAAMKGMLDPIFKEVVIGKVEVRATFKVPNIGVIAGGYVIEGKVTRNAGLRLVREGIVIHEGKVSSLKRFKDDAKEVLTNFECGIGIENYNDLREGDIIEAFINEEVKR